MIRRARGGIAALGPGRPWSWRRWVVDDYTTSILARTLALGLVAVSVALLTGVAGLPTLGQTAPYAAGAYAVRRGRQPTSPTSASCSSLAAAAAGALLPRSPCRSWYTPGASIVLMITLASANSPSPSSGSGRSVTGGTDGLLGFARRSARCWGSPTLASDRATLPVRPGRRRRAGRRVLLVLRYPGRAVLRAGRDDETRMRASGHPVAAVPVRRHVAAGAIAGAAGSLLVTVQQYVSPATSASTSSALRAARGRHRRHHVGRRRAARRRRSSSPTRDWLLPGCCPATRRWCSARCSWRRSTCCPPASPGPRSAASAGAPAQPAAAARAGHRPGAAPMTAARRPGDQPPVRLARRPRRRRPAHRTTATGTR